MEKLLKKHAEKIRFGIVGAANTGLDFVLLFFLVSLGLDKLIANYFSTGLSFVFSFFANKSFTFKNRASGNTKKQFIVFLAVSISGLWILQPLVILLMSYWLSPYINNVQLELLIVKLIATVASLTWNYLLYSMVVFKKPTPSETSRGDE